MIMPRGAPLLLPVKPRFIVLTLCAGVLMQMGLGMAAPTQARWLPDLLALVLLFWSIHQPRRVGVGVAFVLGLMMDVHQGELLGQNALAYALMAYGAAWLHRRVLWFDVRTQSLHVLPLLVLAHATGWMVVALSGLGWVSHWQILAPLIETALWPVLSVLLLAPQRGAHNPDETRPL